MAKKKNSYGEIRNLYADPNALPPEDPQLKDGWGSVILCILGDLLLMLPGGSASSPYTGLTARCLNKKGRKRACIAKFFLVELMFLALLLGAQLSPHLKDQKVRDTMTMVVVAAAGLAAVTAGILYRKTE